MSIGKHIMTISKLFSALLIVVVLAIPGLSNAATPATKNGVTIIHLDEYNGYFAAQETLAGLKPGKYKFVIANKTKKVVGFWLQDPKTKKFFDQFPLEVGETRTVTANITENGFRYRCPINPTAWYDVGVSK